MSDKEERLERNLGLGAALSIGVGTMIGAGLFVLPGIAAGKAGPAAILSFAIGGVIAFLVAACTAELATIMPSSGGAYTYVARIFGDFAGFVVGCSQAAGLVFASAFYLVAFSRYAIDVLAEFGLSPGEPSVLMASGAALVLTGINLFGARNAANLQNSVVGALAAILMLLFGYGLLEVIGVFGASYDAGEFAPGGYSAVFTTATLVFVSYLGFVQIATVAGEVRRPQRNLPLALLGSVVLVTTLYVLALFVATRVIDSATLGELGENGTVEVARRLVGHAGATAIMFAGALAALSSANASILSASRTLFAMGQDGLAPSVTARISTRFNTPYAALWIIGIPIMALVFLDDLEPLAETASALHLVIYALICLALIVCRIRYSDLARERFRLPWALAVGGIGALSCVGLLFFMPRHANLAVLAIVTVVSLMYLFRSRTTQSTDRA